MVAGVSAYNRLHFPDLSRCSLCGLIALILVLACGIRTRAEDALKALAERWPWRVFDRQEGLGSGPVLAIHHDRRGYIYAATEQGIYRYDMWEWTEVARAQPGAEGAVRRFVESFGSLYAVTDTTLMKVQAGAVRSVLYRGSGLHVASSQQGEIFILDQGAGKHLQIRGESLEQVDPEVRLPSGTFQDYQVDAERTHWLVTSEGLAARERGRRAWSLLRDRELEPRLQGRRCSRFFCVQGPAEGPFVVDERVQPPAWEELWALFEDPTASSAPAMLARLERGQWKAVAEVESPALQGLLCDSIHNYYATGEDGRLRFSPDGRNWSIVQDLGIGKVALFAGTVDSSGTLWFRRAAGGIAVFDPLCPRWETIPTGSEQTFPNVLSLIETEEGEIWMGMTKGISRYRRGERPKTYDSVHGVPLNRITGLGEDRQRRIWVSSEVSFPGAFCLTESTWTQEKVPGFSDYPIRRIVRDRVGELWFLSQEEASGGVRFLYHCSPYTSYRILPVQVPHGPVNDLIRTGEVLDSRDAFWLATDEGLLKGTMDGSTFRVDRRYTEESGLRSRRVFAVAEGPDGAIWVCYLGFSAGVTRIKGEDAVHFDVQDGLASPEVWSIAVTGQSIWFGTDRGLSRFDGECWYNYAIASSDPHTSWVLPVFPSILETDSVLVGTWGLGALRFRLDDRQRPKRPRFTRLNLPTRVGPDGNVIFSWDARDFRKDTPPDALQFRSRLDQERWTSFSSTRERGLHGLSPGPHVFELEVRDLDGNSNKEELVHRFEVGEASTPHAVWIAVLVAPALALAALACLIGPRLLRALKRRRLHLRLFESYPLPWVVVDDRGLVLEVSRLASELLRLDPLRPASFVGKPLSNVHALSGGRIREAVRSLLEGEPFWIRHHAATLENGEERVLEIRGFPLSRSPFLAGKGTEGCARSGSATGGDHHAGLALIVLEDMTRAAEEERLLERSRRLNSLRSLAARIVSSAGDLFRDLQVGDTERPNPALLERLRQLEVLLSRLTLFAGKTSDRSSWVNVSVNDLLDELLGEPREGPALQERFRAQGHVRVDYRGQPGLWSVLGDAAVLSRAVLEVLENASESMPERGTLTVRTSNLRVEQDPGLLAPGPYVEIFVKDTGTGMEAGQLEHVFEPFYSTKPRDQALGIGLATAYGIVRSHGGDIRVDSRPGAGTTVRVLLPASRGQ